MTQFADKVRAIVKQVPKGTVLSYKQVAYASGKPNAARAVANIMANNYDKTVPCHRVIRSDGRLGGYNRGGVAKKRQLLQAEGYSHKYV